MPARLPLLLVRALAAAWCALHASGSFAQTATDEGYRFSFQFENDLFAKGRTDQWYTNGLRAAFESPWWGLAHKEPSGLVPTYSRWAGQFMCLWSGCTPERALVASVIHGGQNMYTPRRIDHREASPFDRPYAGWLYLGQRALLTDDPTDPKSTTATRLQTLDVVVGVVGPAAGAGTVQRAWHDLIQSEEPLGWDTQLRAYFSPSWTAFQADRGRYFSVIVDGISG